MKALVASSIGQYGNRCLHQPTIIGPWNRVGQLPPAQHPNHWRRNRKEQADVVADYSVRTLAGAMERANRNIDELLTKRNGTFHRLGQSRIDEELFDVYIGVRGTGRTVVVTKRQTCHDSMPIMVNGETRHSKWS
jgi:hypothetical protein